MSEHQDKKSLKLENFKWEEIKLQDQPPEYYAILKEFVEQLFKLKGIILLDGVYLGCSILNRYLQTLPEFPQKDNQLRKITYVSFLLAYKWVDSNTSITEYLDELLDHTLFRQVDIKTYFCKEQFKILQALDFQVETVTPGHYLEFFEPTHNSEMESLFKQQYYSGLYNPDYIQFYPSQYCAIMYYFSYFQTFHKEYQGQLLGYPASLVRKWINQIKPRYPEIIEID